MINRFTTISLREKYRYQKADQLHQFIQKNIPSLIIIPAVIVFVELIMYFTIENPDIKLLEELHRSKEISDNANEEKTLFLYNMTQEIRSITSKIDDDADLILESKDWNETYDTCNNKIVKSKII